MEKMLYITVSKKGRYSYDRMIEYATKMAKQKKSIPVTPQSITDEILTMVNRLSEVYLSSIMYPPDYFERKYLVQKKDYERSGCGYRQLVPDTSVHPQLSK